MEIMYYIFLMLISLLAGTMDAISGGGGILTIPALLSLGICPQIALGTNKLQSSFGSFTSTISYMKAGLISKESILVGIACTGAGAFLGSLSILSISQRTLNYIIIVMLMIVFCYFLMSSNREYIKLKLSIPMPLFYFVFGLLIGFYDGFFGPGTGSFWAFLFLSVAGYNLKNATANTKLLNFTSNIVALIVFLSQNMIIVKLGLMMGFCQIMGAMIGSRFVIKKDVVYIKFVYLIVITVIMIKIMKELLE